ncbi:MAG: CPBP family glutamic-type intramembrane protease [Thermoproteus sp.]
MTDRGALYLALAYIALLAALDVASAFLPTWASVYGLAALETAFFVSFRWVRLKYSSRGLYNALLLFFVWFMATAFLSPFLASGEAAAETQDLYKSGLLPIIVVVFVLEEPVVSESIFRGVLFQQLSARNRALAYVVSSLAYSLLLTAPDTATEALVAALYFLLGLILAYAYEKGGFASALAVHAVYSVLYTASLILSAIL